MMWMVTGSGLGFGLESESDPRSTREGRRLLLAKALAQRLGPPPAEWCSRVPGFAQPPKPVRLIHRRRECRR